MSQQKSLCQQDNPYKKAYYDAPSGTPTTSYVANHENKHRYENSDPNMKLREYKENRTENMHIPYAKDSDVAQPYNIIPTDAVKCMNCGQLVSCKEIQTHMLNENNRNGEYDRNPSDVKDGMGWNCCYGNGDTETIHRGKIEQYPPEPNSYAINHLDDDQVPVIPFKNLQSAGRRGEAIELDQMSFPLQTKADMMHQHNPMYQQKKLESTDYTYKPNKPARYSKNMVLDWGEPVEKQHINPYKIQKKLDDRELNFKMEPIMRDKTILDMGPSQTGPRTASSRTDLGQFGFEKTINSQNVAGRSRIKDSRQNKQLPDDKIERQIPGDKEPVVFVPRNSIITKEAYRQPAGSGSGCSCGTACCNNSCSMACCGARPMTTTTIPGDQFMYGPTSPMMLNSRPSISNNLVERQPTALRSDRSLVGSKLQRRVIGQRQYHMMSKQQIQRYSKVGSINMSKDMQAPIYQYTQVEENNCCSASVACCDRAPATRQVSSRTFVPNGGYSSRMMSGGPANFSRMSGASGFYQVQYRQVMRPVMQPVYTFRPASTVYNQQLVPVPLKSIQQAPDQYPVYYTANDGQYIIHQNGQITESRMMNNEDPTPYKSRKRFLLPIEAHEIIQWRNIFKEHNGGVMDDSKFDQAFTDAVYNEVKRKEEFAAFLKERR